MEESRLADHDSHMDSRRQGLKAWDFHTLLIGQAIALLTASVNASSFTLQYHLDFFLPAFNMMIMYGFLSLNLLGQRHPVPSSHDDHWDSCSGLPYVARPRLCLRTPVHVYLCISILDVGSNFMTLLSFQYTSLTSTTLLGSLTIPSTMLCCRLLLQVQYRAAHYVGVVLCLVGGTITVWSDQWGRAAVASTHPQQQHSYVGDSLAMSAALLYGLSDAVAEYFVKRMDRSEYLGMLGVFGSLLCFCLVVFFESSELGSLVFDTDPVVQIRAFATMVWYIVSLYLYYNTASLFLIQSDATLLNLSLQTSSLWAVLFSVIVSHILPPCLFYVALALVSSGVIVFEICGTRRWLSKTIPSVEETELFGGHRDYQSITQTI